MGVCKGEQDRCQASGCQHRDVLFTLCNETDRRDAMVPAMLRERSKA